MSSTDDPRTDPSLIVVDDTVVMAGHSARWTVTGIVPPHTFSYDAVLRRGSATLVRDCGGRRNRTIEVVQGVAYGDITLVRKGNPLTDQLVELYDWWTLPKLGAHAIYCATRAVVALT